MCISFANFVSCKLLHSYLAIIVTPHAWHVSLHVAAFAAQNLKHLEPGEKQTAIWISGGSNCRAVAALFTHERHAISLCFESACQIKLAGPRANHVAFHRHF